MNKHEFAIFFQSIDDFQVDELIKIDQEQIYHRIIRVLRLQINDHIILFNKDINAIAKILSIEKKYLTLCILNKNNNIKNKPKITMLISVLKREAFQEAIYSCVETGINVIQPILTHKVHLTKFDQKEFDRFQGVVISAAEQSKNFDFSDFNKPISFQDLIAQLDKRENVIKIYFDVQGQNILDVINLILEKSLDKSLEEIFLMVGPEGDLTQEEKNILKGAQFKFCSLTTTILRAQSAVALASGIFRSACKT